MSCCGNYGLTFWELDGTSTDGQISEWNAGLRYFCDKCGQTTNIDNFYSNFLRSKQWKGIRFKCFIRDEFTCKDCGKECSEVHHFHYENILDVDSCTSLCHECHNKKHNKNNSKINGWAKSINIKNMAKRNNFLTCPKCKNNFYFYGENGFFCCYNCEEAGTLKDFAELIIKKNKLHEYTRFKDIIKITSNMKKQSQTNEEENK